MSLNKEALYGNFLKSYDRRERLADLATRKALDLPVEDEVNINTTTNNQGSHWLTTLLMAGSLLLGGGGLTAGLGTALGWFAQGPTAAPRSASAPPSAQEYRVEFFTEEGKPIKVQKQ